MFEYDIFDFCIDCIFRMHLWISEFVEFKNWRVFVGEVFVRASVDISCLVFLYLFAGSWHVRAKVLKWWNEIMSNRLGSVMESNSLVDAFAFDIAVIRDLMGAGLSMADASFQLGQNSYLPEFFHIMKMGVSRWIEIVCSTMNINSPGGGFSRELAAEFNKSKWWRLENGMGFIPVFAIGY